MNAIDAASPYQKIDAAHWARVFLVGDLHGCYDMLMTKLERQRFDQKRDLLIALGDLIDRGPQSEACLPLLENPWFRSVRGNHEQMAIDALRTGDDRLWLANGGRWFYQLTGADRQRARQGIDTCARLPLVIDLTCGQRRMVIAHADYPLDHYVFGQDIDGEAVLWSRKRIGRHQQGRGKAITGASHFFFGHTPVSRVRHYYNQYYIDTGAVFGGTLTLIELTSLPF
ncbi:Putative serine/threonine-protein phosphatase 1 [Sodalis praecaptivus]|uniref:Putative serine/threonine-protein phosphatase 1 n=1 Tax=Sodalis praecaptivus TaxID=1239307 RepID=W0HTP2_9GAMM|nr:metallophosphoesterase [Sodalis praecaptivus]AHF77211.1 Putative serine/threonine-protein phosphatase 1 [Sodalis praecaptivus]